MTRKQSRDNAFKIVFSLYANGEPDFEEPFDCEDGTFLEQDDFCKSIVSAVTENIEKIDEIIAARLSKGWTVARLPKTSLAIMRMSIAQLVYMQDIPAGVVINEGVELSKHYGDDNDYKFVNGALGAYVRSDEYKQLVENK